MQELALGLASALGLGLLTSISPCPLATNIAAITYIGRRVSSPRQVFLTGLLYTLGRMFAYLGLAVLLLASALSIPRVSMFLQQQMPLILGPLLIIVGAFLLGLFSFNLPGGGMAQAAQRRADTWGMWGALVLGAVFALSFCPVSAALFFGSLLPLALQAKSPVVVPSVYGLGTALPVVVFAGLIAFSAQTVGRAFQILTKVEWWMRTITGAGFIAIGCFLSLRDIFGLFGVEPQ